MISQCCLCLGLVCFSDVEASVRLKTALKIFASEGGRTKAFDVQRFLFSNHINQQGDHLFQLFVFSGRTHDLQSATVISEPWGTFLLISVEQLFVSFPTHVTEEHSLFWLDQNGRDRMSSSPKGRYFE